MALILLGRTGAESYDDSWFVRTRRTRSKVRMGWVKLYDPWCKGIQTHIAYIFYYVVVWGCCIPFDIYIVFHTLAYEFWFINFRSPVEWKTLEAKTSDFTLNCARNSATHSPESQIKCFAFDTLIVLVIQFCRMPKIILFYCEIGERLPTIGFMYSVSGRSSDSLSKLRHG